jgi:N-acyl-D-amino-acid deacylase
MYKFFCALLVLAAAGGDCAAEDVRSAVEKGLRRLEQGASNYVARRRCFSCHHQALPMLSLASAQRRGFEVQQRVLDKQTAHTVDYFRARKDDVQQGKGVDGGALMAGYPLFALEAVGHAADDVTAALVEYLLQKQKADGSWVAVAERLPSEGSPFTPTALALRGLQHYGPARDAAGADELRRRIDKAIAGGRAWLRRSQPVTTEDRVFHLCGLAWVGEEEKAVAAARDALVRGQRADGSWGQEAGMAGDAYACGTALVALRAAGMAAGDKAFQRGIKYLVDTQKPDGSWIVQTRARPVQVFFDNGDPGGKSQFLSMAATGWAVLALLETIAEQEPKKRAGLDLGYPHDQFGGEGGPDYAIRKILWPGPYRVLAAGRVPGASSAALCQR